MDQHSAIPKITVLRGSCADDETCPIEAKVSSRPGRTYYIAAIETESDILAAFQGRIGPGEILVWQPENLPAAGQ